MTGTSNQKDCIRRTNLHVFSSILISKALRFARLQKILGIDQGPTINPHALQNIRLDYCDEYLRKSNFLESEHQRGVFEFKFRDFGYSKVIFGTQFRIVLHLTRNKLSQAVHSAMTIVFEVSWVSIFVGLRSSSACSFREFASLTSV